MTLRWISTPNKCRRFLLHAFVTNTRHSIQHKYISKYNTQFLENFKNISLVPDNPLFIKLIYIDYYMAFFISHPILARDHCISVQERLGPWADIQWPRANKGCDIKNVNHDFCKRNKLNKKNHVMYDYCQQNAWCLLVINFPVNLHHLFQPVCIPVPCWRRRNHLMSYPDIGIERRILNSTS